MNKKTLLTSLLLFCVTIVSYAQEYTSGYLAAPSRNEYLLKDPLWYISVGAGAQAYHGEDDAKVSFHRRMTFAPNFTIGRRLGNLAGIRVQVTGGSLHGFNDGDSGIYSKWLKERYYNVGKLTFDPQWTHMGWKEGVDFEHALAPDGVTRYWRAKGGEDKRFYMQELKYLGVYADFTLNLVNLIEGYKPNRKFELNPFIGAGVFRRFEHWGNIAQTYFGTSGGVNLGYNLDPSFGLFTEFRGTVVSDEFDGQVGDMSFNALSSLTFGVTYKFGSPKYIDPSLDTRYNLPYSIARSKDNLVLVPGGNIDLGTRVDPLTGDSVPGRIVAVSPFWMDETEVTNSQYREFVYWVRDSIIRERLASPSYGGDPTYKVLVRRGEGEPVGQRLNWMKKIPWTNPTAREASAISSVVGQTGLKGDIAGMDPSILNYKYDWFDSKSYFAFLANQKKDGQPIEISKDTAYVNYEGEIIRETISRVSTGSPADFTNTYIINIYPDVLSWVTDFANAKNEQYAKNYFTTTTFDKFPVVGVSWEQADAYCAWRTDQYKSLNRGQTDGFEGYRLPTEAEWVFAAKNGRSELMYPWYSDSPKTMDGLANSNYRASSDLKDLIAPVATFLPNRFGLYDMAGNVSEWTNTTYTQSVDLMSDEINPDYSYRAVLSDPDILKRKIVKGGSWKDTDESLRANARSVEYQNKGRSYIGFRCVRSWGIDQKGRIN